MKRFKFSLQAVHDLRETAREEAERHLARAGAEVSHAAAELDRVLRLRETETANHLARLQRGALDAHEIALHMGYLDALAQREREARAHLLAAERARDERRQAAVAATQAAEATAKLRERESRRHQLEAARTEQNMLDEMATLSLARRLMEGAE